MLGAALTILAASCASSSGGADEQQIINPLTSTGARAAPSDFNGGAGSERAVWNPSSGVWTVENAADVQWGQAGDIPVAGDFDGDGKADRAVVRPDPRTVSSSVWWVLKSGGGVTNVPWGAAGDIPISGDFDGDRRTDPAIYRPASGQTPGQWWAILSSDNSQRLLGNWGGLGDVPIAGDFNGDGKTDLAVYRPAAQSQWWVAPSNPDNTFNTSVSSPAAIWGNSTDWPIAGDFDNDGRTDFAVWRPESGQWWVINGQLPAPSGGVVAQWGSPGDIPIAFDVDGDGKIDPTIWRNGDWWVYGRGYLGSIGGGIPLPYQATNPRAIGACTNDPVIIGGRGGLRTQSLCELN